MPLAKLIKGDRAVWALSAALALLSFLAFYSASSNLAQRLPGGGDTLAMLGKHAIHLAMGFTLMYLAHSIPQRYYGNLSLIALPLVVLLLVYTLFQGQKIEGAEASRWIDLPFGLSFQTSALASLALSVYMARYLSLKAGEKPSFKESFVPLLLPLLLVCGLILPANLSTAVLVFFMGLILLFVGQYPLKNIALLLGIGLLALLAFVGLVKLVPNISNRVDTWEARIERYVQGDQEEGYQAIKARIAIAEGGLFGKGSGKSTQKYFLPQSSSDFIYAVIVEEYGLIGGFVVLLLYMWLFIRFLRIATKAKSMFGTLLTVGCGSGLILQAIVNMGVATTLLPVTGQTLPLLSAGGSSIWMTCLALGIVLSVSRSNQGEEEAVALEPELNAQPDVA